MVRPRAEAPGQFEARHQGRGAARPDALDAAQLAERRRAQAAGETLQQGRGQVHDAAARVAGAQDQGQELLVAQSLGSGAGQLLARPLHRMQVAQEYPGGGRGCVARRPGLVHGMDSATRRRTS